MKEIPPADLKTVASSSAILQRSNAFHFDLPSEPSLSEGKDTGSSFDDNSPEEGSYLVDNTRPVFTVGGSKEVITKGFKMSERDSDRFLQDIPKTTFLSNGNDQLESFKSMKSASVPDNAKQFIGYSGNNYTFEECTEISKKYADSSSKIKKVKES
ncbi:uncharacterized protein LOC118187435 [Stegodyphus dumicola]|uniref:uncharacterized protein LOC118187435 n=1 Tax=Stegodyphus dumicola TaxID=202533 RepID=UPI0015AF16B6|nr:uncharacterized protein LOC118187435 [Stegodyphus dumicola]